MKILKPIQMAFGFVSYLMITLTMVTLLRLIAPLNIGESIAILVFVFGTFEFNRWRNEMIGKEELNLALQISALVIRIRDQLQTIRHPLTPLIDEEGLKETNNLLQELYQLRARAEFMWEDNITEEVRVINKKYVQLRTAMHILNQPVSTKWAHSEAMIESQNKIRYSLTDNDMYDIELNIVVENLKKKLRQKMNS